MSTKIEEKKLAHKLYPYDVVRWIPKSNILKVTSPNLLEFCGGGLLCAKF